MNARTDYHVVAAGGSAGSRRTLAIFSEAQGGEKSARAFAELTKDSHEAYRNQVPVPPPALSLEIEVVFTKSETTRIIRL